MGRRHGRSRALGALVIVLAASMGIVSIAAGAKLAVGRNHRVSDDGLVRAAGAHGVVHQAEADLAIDPSDPRHLLGGAQEKRLGSGAALANGFYVSDDGGRSWARGLIPGTSQLVGGPYQRATDPVVALGASGAAYYCSLALDFGRYGPTRDAILLNRSPDGGHTWGPPITVARSHWPFLLDKEWLAVDTGPDSPRAGTLYVVWLATSVDNVAFADARSRIFISRSTDGGLTWSKPARISAVVSDAGPIVLVRPNGDLAVAFLRLGEPRQSIHVARSGDGGRHWSKPLTAATYVPARRVRVARYVPGFVRGLRADFGLAAAVEPSSGALYLAWQQVTRHRGVLPPSPSFRGDPSDIVTARSTDGGRRWREPVRVPDRGRKTAQFMPAIAASGHRLGVLFYERVGLRHPHRYQVSFTRSRTSGRGYGRPVRVSPHFDARNASPSDRGRFFGDYAGLVETGASTQALWVDSRHRPQRSGPSGGNDVFTARIRVP